MSVTSIVEELKSKVKLKIRMGAAKVDVLNSTVMMYGEQLGIEPVKELVNGIIEEFGDYELIQMILRSKIAQDIEGRDNYILDPKTRKVQRITRERLREVIHYKLDISEKIYTCAFKYDPFTMKQLYKTSEGLWVYNQYNPPPWQAEVFYGAETAIEPEEAVPEIYKKFLFHLVDQDPLSYEYVLDWLANALQHRNFCILTTIGAQGIGKGTLAEIMSLMVGASNYVHVGNSILAERFNGQIKNKRIVYCDEASVKTLKEEEKLKALVNNSLEIEAKGKDAENILNHSSFYFSSNSLDSIKLPADDRRFSIVNLTDAKLPTVMTVKQIKSLLKYENIDKFARYLYFREVNEDRMLKVFISKRTEEIRSASLAGWHDWFLDEYAYDRAGETVKVQDISDAVEDKFGSKFRPSKKAFIELSKIYPEKLKVFKPTLDGKQVWAVTFPARGGDASIT